jgi:CP12 domain
MTNSQEQTMTIEDRIEQARDYAHKAGEEFGKTSPEYIVAMDTLEELHQEAGHRSAAKPKSSLERHCSDNPEAPECLIYDN